MKNIMDHLELDYRSSEGKKVSYGNLKRSLDKTIMDILENKVVVLMLVTPS